VFLRISLLSGNGIDWYWEGEPKTKWEGKITKQKWEVFVETSAFMM
jgi:hypothetical protein